MNNAVPAKHPRGLYVLFFTEMWERFGYYLMLGILYLYMTDKESGLAFDEAFANDIYGTYIALVYLTPFLGGLLADRIFGYRSTIIAGGLLMAGGYLTLSLPGVVPFYTALLLVILGNGFFKPNISTLLGNLYNTPANASLKDKGYNIFYMGINIGAFVCNFVAAYMRNNYGWGHAFAAAGAGMLLGLIIFVAGQKHIKEADVIQPTQAEDMPLGQIFGYIFVPALLAGALGYFLPRLMGVDNFLGSTTNDIFLFACLPIIIFYVSLYVKASVSDKRAIGALLYIFFVVIIFWMIFHQNGNVLTEWAKSYTDRSVSNEMQANLAPFGFLEEIKMPEDIKIPEAPDAAAIAQSMQEELPYYFKNMPPQEWPAPGNSIYVISTELFQSLNPFFIIIFTPLVIAFFNFLQARGVILSTPAKIAWGLFITGLSTLVMVAAVFASQNGAVKVSAWWLVGTYAVITVGELFLSPMGLSLVSKLSPQRLTAVMMGGWFLATAIGNKLSGVVGHVGAESSNLALPFYINFAGAMLAAILLFVKVRSIAKVVKEKTGHY